MKNILFLLAFVPCISFGQQTVKGTFAPAEDFTYAFLYKATPDGANYVNRGQLDSLGQFEIPLDSTVTSGIYKIVYAIPPEENNFDFIYDGKESVAFTFNRETGVHFIESEENKLWNSYLKSMEMVNHTISNYYEKNNLDKKGFNAIFKTLKDTQTAYEELAKGKMVFSFIKANRPYIPTGYEDIGTYSKHLKKHYLSQLDFGDDLLKSSSFLTDRVTAYVFNMVADPDNSTYKQHIDDVALAVNKDDLTIKSNILEMLWQHFVNAENYEIANYITDTYLLHLAQSTKNKALENVLITYKNTSIGSKAPNFDIALNGEQTSLYQLEGAENYLLIFWSSNCSHCLSELPKVKALVADKPNLKVVAFGLEHDEIDWKREIKHYPDFIHQIGLDKWDNPVVRTYGISATPMYFLLNSSKVIMAKPYDFEALKTELEQF